MKFLLTSLLGIILCANASATTLNCPDRVKAGETFQVTVSGNVNNWNCSNDCDISFDHEKNVLKVVLLKPGGNIISTHFQEGGITESQCEVDVGNPNLYGQVRISEVDSLLQEIELINESATHIDLTGWVFYDSDDTHELFLTTDNSKEKSLIIPPNGKIEIISSNDNDLYINTNGYLRLYSGPIEMLGELQDEVDYPLPEGLDNDDNKSGNAENTDQDDESGNQDNPGTDIPDETIGTVNISESDTENKKKDSKNDGDEEKTKISNLTNGVNDVHKSSKKENPTFLAGLKPKKNNQSSEYIPRWRYILMGIPILIALIAYILNYHRRKSRKKV